MIFFSVILSVYNGEKYIGKAIESIVNQTYGNFEFLICDDCSNDSSLEVVKSYDDYRIKLLCNRVNIGLTRTLNRLISAAKGQYIVRMDADDISHPNRLKRYADIIESFDDLFVFSNYIKINDHDFESGYSDLKNTDIKTSLLSGENPICHGSICFPNKKWLRYDERFRYAQDYLFYLKALDQLKIVFLEDYLYSLRFSAESVSFKKSFGQLKVKLYVFINWFFTIHKRQFLWSIIRKLYYTVYIFCTPSHKVNKRRT